MIQDQALVLGEAQSLTGAASGSPATPYTPSTNTYQIGTDQNADVDIGGGHELVIEFEVTEAFTGYVSATQIPHLIPCVAVASDAALTSNVSLIGLTGWPVNLFSEFGLQPSDSASRPNLFLGDKYHCKINPGDLGLPYRGTAGTRNNALIPARSYIGAMYILLMRTGQTVYPLNAALWTAADFTAGKMTSRILINHAQEQGRHHYASGFKA